MNKTTITIKLNGEDRTVDVEANDLLSEVLRGRLGVKSPKVGCDRGDCGSCTIFLDGRTVRSCLVLAIEADGREIETLEGLSGKGETGRLQKAMHKRNSFQCGYCAPGMVLSATELLRKDSKPSDADIKESLSGNLCRCTGYSPIVDAVREAAKESRGRTRK